ncbi:MAG: cytochrome b5-like heme/steroid binding domain-containing protein [Minisyncoccia bacterium]
MNQILFGFIGLLMFAITGIGFAEVKIQRESRILNTADSQEISIQEIQNSGLEAADGGERSVSSKSTEDSVAAALTDAAHTVVDAVTRSGKDEAFASSREFDDEDDEKGEDEDDDDKEKSKSNITSTQTATAASVPKSTQTNTTASTNTTNTAPASGAFTMTQVAMHNSAASCYSVVSGVVYDLTSYVSKHPGGQSAIKSICGVDGTAGFGGQHGGQSKPTNTLAQFKIGVLAQ